MRYTLAVVAAALVFSLAAPVSGADRSPPAPGEGAAAQEAGMDEPINYTLGPDDVIDITVARHAEFSGIFPVNPDGKIQYKFIGDLDVNGYT